MGVWVYGCRGVMVDTMYRNRRGVIGGSVEDIYRNRIGIIEKG